MYSSLFLVLCLVIAQQSAVAFQLSSTTSLASTVLKSRTFAPHRSLSSSFMPMQMKSQLSMSLQATASASDLPSKKPQNEQTNFKQPAPKTLKKLLPLGAMLFFILFNYTILRDTKDVLVVTAPNSGAEIIPFLKTYVNLPSAIGFTVLYSYLTNKMSADKVFYLVMSTFLTFFGAFATVICK